MLDLYIHIYIYICIHIYIYIYLYIYIYICFLCYFFWGGEFHCVLRRVSLFGAWGSGHTTPLALLRIKCCPFCEGACKGSMGFLPSL